MWEQLQNNLTKEFKKKEKKKIKKSEFRITREEFDSYFIDHASKKCREGLTNNKNCTNDELIVGLENKMIECLGLVVTYNHFFDHFI